MTGHESQFQRWYDQDPALSRAMEHLRSASDKHQAQIALNILKIIAEHQLEGETVLAPEELDGNQHRLSEFETPGPNATQKRRWYDVNETLCSAIQLLRDCPDDLQQSILPTIARMIDRTLQDCDGLSTAD